MWGREVNNTTLTFHLAGINNQNFLMRDEETGTFWQQISGLAISGPLRGRQLRLIHSDELTFAAWRTEEPQGTVLADVPVFTSQYAGREWDVRMKTVPMVISHSQPGLAARELMLGVHAPDGVSRAYPFDTVLQQKLINDRIGSEPLVVVVGSDGESVRVFRARLTGREDQTLEFYRLSTAEPIMMDGRTGSKWTFRGCAVEGPATGQCLEKIEAIKDYWFDWREYNPATTVYHSPTTVKR